MSAGRLFLSYNRKDGAAVASIADQLRARGILIWRDADDIAVGSSWLYEIETAIKTCSAAAIFYGPSGPGQWQREEEVLALQKSKSDKLFRLIPIVLPGGEIPEGLILGTRNWVVFSALDDPPALNQVISAITGEGQVDPPLTVECPYPGLDVFDEEHAGLFFGRKDETEHLLDRIRGMLRPESLRFAGLIGGSGSGKSSLMRAGLLHQLKNGVIPGSNTWRFIDFTPGGDALKALAAQIMILEGGPPSGERLTRHIDSLKNDPKMFDRDVTAALSDRPNGRVVVLADQMEEVFANSKEDRTAFFDGLLEAAACPGGRTIVLFTLRTDFYGRCTEHPLLSKLLPANHALVGPMGPNQLRDAITKPALARNCEVEPALVNTLITECEGEPGNLPLLQFVLRKLWHNLQGNKLTLASYDRSGGISQALDQHAESIYTSFTSDEQKICKSLFLQLTQAWGEDCFTKREINYESLFAQQSDALYSTNFHRVLDRLSGSDARLITIPTGDALNEVKVDLAHEKLLTSWQRLKGWLKEESSFLDWRQRLDLSIRDWNRNQRSADCLLHGRELVDARTKRKDRSHELTSEEKDFIDTSTAVFKEQRLKRFLRDGLLTLAGLAAIAGIVFWLRGRTDLLDRTRNAIASHSPCAPVYALYVDHLKLKSVSGISDSVTLEFLEEAVQGASYPYLEIDDEAQIRDLKFSPDGKYLGAASDKGITLNTAPMNLNPFSGPVNSISFAGESIAASDNSGQVKIIKIASSEPTYTLLAQKSPVTAMAFSGNGDLLILGLKDGNVAVWNRAQPEKVEPLGNRHSDAITSIAFNSDGSQFATASLDGTAKRWSLQSRSAKNLPRKDITVDTVGFVAQNLFAGTRNGSVRSWDRANNPATVPLVTRLNGMAVSGDGTTLATSQPGISGGGNTLRIWNFRSISQPVLTIELPGSNVRMLALNFNGDQLAVATKGKVLLYDLNPSVLRNTARRLVSETKQKDAGSINACRDYFPKQ